MPEPASGTPRTFLVPDLGEGLANATVVRWLVGLGDEVVLNQPIVVLETEKAEVEVPSPYAGTVTEFGGAAGETLAVGAVLARVEEAASAGAAAPPPAGAPTATGTREPTLVGYGADESADRSRRRRRRHAVAVDGGPAAPPAKPLAKPPVRKLARSLGVDLASLTGSGARGIVTRADVEAAARPVAAPATPRTRPTVGDEVIAVRGVRARVAERMATSRSSIPDATASVTVDCTRLLDVRATLNRAAESAGQVAVITPFALVCRFIVLALRSNRALNATFVEDGPEIRRHGAVHLGLGTATERGLVVTVVHHAETMTTLELATEMARLAAAARAGTVSPAELVGSTFTVSNFGALGIDEGIPVINYPEAAIVGVGAIKPRPHVVDGEVVARSTATLTLAFDHRVCDGAEAGSFLTALQAMVEVPELALLAS
jgi:2-oxoisovalerate dehydrogenase E2 component (dihydrolipoyl transacylase)